MKHTKRIFSFFIAALLAFGVAIPAAHAAPNDDALIFSVGGDDGIFEIYNGLEWKALTVPFWMEAEDGNWAFCLESDKPQPMGDNYSMSSAVYNENVLNGIRTILLHGFPNNLGGLTETQAHYATQVAIWTWMWEKAGVGYQSYAESNVRAASGHTAAFVYYVVLMDTARRGADTINYSARFNPHPVVLRPNGSGRLVGTTTIEFVENVDSYSIDQTRLPAGVSIQGNTYLNGDTVTVTAPLYDAGKTFTTYDIFHLNSKRTPANIFWYEPGGGNLQNMVVYDMSFQPAAIPLTIKCEDIKEGRLVVKKVNSNPNLANYSLAGGIFDIYNYDDVLVDTITTTADGIATSKLLPLGFYSVIERQAPEGYVHDGTHHWPCMLSEDVLEVTIPNAPQMGIVRLTKTNASPNSGSYSLAGAVFEVRNSGGTLVDTITTDAQGKANSKQLPLGSYTVTEKTAPAGYVRNTSSFPANLVYGGQKVEIVYVDVAVAEQPQTGVIRVNKTNANRQMGDHSLAGAVFEILNVDGDLIDTVTTNASGYAESKNLPLGSYYVAEKTAPTGYLRDSKNHSVTLSYANQDVAVVYGSVTIAEQPQLGVITINKTNADATSGDYSLKDAVFEIRDSQSKLVDTVTTDDQGQAKSKQLPLGEYVVTEKTAPYGFLRDTNEYDAVLTYAGQDVAVAAVTVNVPEQPQKGKISIKRPTQIRRWAITPSQALCSRFTAEPPWWTRSRQTRKAKRRARLLSLEPTQ